MFAHIFKSRIKGQFELVLSRCAEITAEYVVSTTTYATKNDAKAAAKTAGAKAWNY